MRSCSVRGCGRRSIGAAESESFKLYSFPKDPDLQKIWIEFCDSKKALSNSARICSRHFEKKFLVKRLMDVALGLDCPMRFRNIAKNAVPTLYPPTKGQAKIKDEDSALNVDSTMEEDPVLPASTEEEDPEKADSAPESVDSGSETPRYLSEQVPEKLPEVVCVSQPVSVKSSQSAATDNQETDTTTSTIPYMAFHTATPAPNNEESPSSSKLAQATKQIDASNASQYVVLKRSVWNSAQKELQLHEKTCKEMSELEAKYIKSLEAVQILNQRLTTGGDSKTKLLLAQVANFKAKNEALTAENIALKKTKAELANTSRALRRDKEKLEERFKEHAILLKQYFTSGQLKRMFADDPLKRSRWSPQDITQALALKTMSLPAYKYLQDRYTFLLPDLATLRRWVRTRKIEMEEKADKNPTEPFSHEDQVAANLILLHEQTIGAEESIDESQGDENFTISL